MEDLEIKQERLVGYYYIITMEEMQNAIDISDPDQHEALESKVANSFDNINKNQIFIDITKKEELEQYIEKRKNELKEMREKLEVKEERLVGNRYTFTDKEEREARELGSQLKKVLAESLGIDYNELIISTVREEYLDESIKTKKDKLQKSKED